MYIPTQDFANVFEREEDFTFIRNQWNLGYKVEASPFSAMLTKALVEGMMDSAMLAWDPVRQQAAWRAPTPRMGNGGALATAGDLVFQGTTDGEFRAYHAGSGEVLWRFDAQHTITAAPVTYAVDGRQYISVLAGRGGGFSLSVGLDGAGQTEQRRLLTFALDGAATLPAVELPAVQRPRPPAVAGDEASIARGGAAYHRFCQRCHGANLFSDGSVPDLRRLEPFWYDQFSEVVLGGTMQGMGMPAFDDVLDEKDVADIRNYVLDGAREDWENHRLQGWWLALRQWWAELLATVMIWLAG
jgi:mono/diheme cytochrome c family protein